MKNILSSMGLFLIILFSSSSAIATVQISTTVSDTNIVLDDLFILTIIINDNDDDYQLDTRPLEQDFTVYIPSQSQSSKYVNGTFTQNSKWRVRLQAKRTGMLTIPALKIGSLNTQPINIKVIAPSEQPAKSNDDESTVFIENSINKESVYIGQSFIFTTKLYISKNSNELDLKAPHFEGAENTVFGQDKNSQTIRNGIRYNTITRQYKMIANQAGQFEIGSPLLTGTLRKVIAISEWQNRVIAQPINARGERLNIHVKSIPEGYQGKWIVSDDLRLIEDNNLTAQSYKVGEPITRSITLQIASIDKDKLPNIKLNYPKSLRVYPDQDQLEEGQANGLNYGIRIIRHAIIADEIGTLVLPEIKINWFNSQTDQQETAVLAAQTLTIFAADKQVELSPTVQAVTQKTQPTIIVDHQSLIYWQISVVLLILIILFMLFYHLSYRRLMTSAKQPTKVKIIPLNQHYLTLQNSFKHNNANLCYNALLTYAQHQYPNLKSLSQFAQQTALSESKKEQLKNEIQILQKCCSDPMLRWNATQLSELIKTEESSRISTQGYDPMKINP